MPTNPTVNVSYDMTTQQWTFDPQELQVHKGTQHIVFNRRVVGNPQWHFHDIKNTDRTTPLPSPPFRSPNISAATILVEDDNSASQQTTYDYSIAIQFADGTVAWSDPQIINRPD